MPDRSTQPDRPVAPDAPDTPYTPDRRDGDSFVFVYGTLRKGEANDINRLMPRPKFMGFGQVAGVLYDLGHYPGAVLQHDITGEAPASAIVGEVYRIAALVEPQLDKIEEIRFQSTDEFLKRRVSVVANGMTFNCLVYEVNPPFATGQPDIACADWVVFRAQRLMATGPLSEPAS